MASAGAACDDLTLMRIRHGVDVEEVRNVAALLVISDRARSRVFTEEEIRCCERAPDPVRRFTGRFCAKEALFKALGRGWQGMGWTEAELGVDETDRPRFVLHGKLKARAETLGVRSIDVSISHTSHLAMASVILVCASADDGDGAVGRRDLIRGTRRS